jgi:hypothetical protein
MAAALRAISPGFGGDAFRPLVTNFAARMSDLLGQYAETYKKGGKARAEREYELSERDLLVVFRNEFREVLRGQLKGRMAAALRYVSPELRKDGAAPFLDAISDGLLSLFEKYTDTRKEADTHREEAKGARPSGAADTHDDVRKEECAARAEAEYAMREHAFLDDFRNNFRAFLEERLKREVSPALFEANPKLGKAVYTSFIEKFLNQLLNVFERYVEARREDPEVAEQLYTNAERNLLVTYLSAVPGAIGEYTPLSKDLADGSIERILKLAELPLSRDDVEYLLNTFHEASTIYVGLAKVGEKEYAESLYRERETNVISNLKTSLALSKKAQEQNDLRRHIGNALEKGVPELTISQKDKAKDQFVWLFRDYTLAPDDEKEQVYSLGEERILLSTFDPVGHRKGLQVRG